MSLFTEQWLADYQARLAASRQAQPAARIPVERGPLTEQRSRNAASEVVEGAPATEVAPCAGPTALPATGALTVRLPYVLSVNRYWAPAAGGRRLMPTKEGSAWKRAARLAADYQLGKQGARCLSGEVSVDIVLHPRQRKDGEASCTRVDLDNVCKVTLDSMQGAMFHNDKDIVDLRIRIGPPLPRGGLTVSAMRVQ